MKHTLSLNAPSTSPYFPSPWPAEDGGPARLQSIAQNGPSAGADIKSVFRRTQLSTMVVLGAPGEVFLLTHSALRAKLGFSTHCWVERIDPVTLKPLNRSPRLEGGPMWPGGLAVHRNGLIHVVYGTYAHALDRQCNRLASRRLASSEPHNSFVLMQDGALVCKNLSENHPAVLQVLCPDTLNPMCAPVVHSEPSIARLSAVGNELYVIGVRSVCRYRWLSDERRLVLDSDWCFKYQDSSHSFGWDAVIDNDQLWFMDNGKHRYLYSMLGVGVFRSANRVFRVSLRNASDVDRFEVSGLAGGSVTNPPLFDPSTRTLVSFDSANAVLRADRFDGTGFSLLWRKNGFGAASHMVLMSSNHTLWVNDYRRFSESVVALDLLTGQEKARVRSKGVMQGVVFPCPDFSNGLYWPSMDGLLKVSW